MTNTDTRDWSFAKRALYELKSQSKPKKKKTHQRREYYWVHVQFTNGRIANYQLPKDLQGPLDQYRKERRDWKSVLLGALINVPTTKYQNGRAKICPAIVREILILPVSAHNPRWITRSQFVKSDYSWGAWLFNRARMEREKSFLTHDFSPANQQRIKAIIDQYRQQRVHRVRQQFWHRAGLTFMAMAVGGLLLWL